TTRPGSIVRAANTVWPTLQPDRYANSVFITYVVGWTTAASIPERIKQGMRLYITYCDVDRDGLIIDGERAREGAELCWDDRVPFIDPVCGGDLYASRAS